MSLFFALKGAEVIRADIEGPTGKARVLHEKYEVDSQVQYTAVNVVHISEKYDEQFDVVTFKSVLGGIGHNDNY